MAVAKFQNKEFTHKLSDVKPGLNIFQIINRLTGKQIPQVYSNKEQETQL